MTYILYFIAIICGITFKKSKLCTAYIYSVMVLLAGFRYQSADLSAYIVEYKLAGQDITVNTRYIGYYYFQKLFTNLNGGGLPFEEYLVLVYMIGFLLLILSICLLTKNINCVLALYLIYSFGMDAIQIKAFLSEVIAFLGIAILIKNYHKAKTGEEKIRNSIVITISVSLMILASLFHFSAFVYFVCGVIYLMIYEKKHIMGKIYMISIISMCITYSGGISYLIVFANHIGVLGDVMYLKSWTSVNTRLGWIIPAIWIIIICFIITKTFDKTDTIDLQVSIKKFTLLVIIILPFLILDVTYCRLIRVFMLLLYTYFVNEKKYKKVKLEQGFSYLLFIVCIVYAFIYEIIPSYNYTLGAMLKYNRLF